MSQPTISSARLELVPLNDSPAHTQLLLDLDTDAEVMRYIAFGRPFDAAECALSREALLKTAEPAGFGTWVAQTKGTTQQPPQLVGWWVLSPSEQADEGGDQQQQQEQQQQQQQQQQRRAEIGLRVARPFWGQGYAKEGTAAVLRYAFESGAALLKDVDVVYGETMTVNTGSRKTMERSGMKLVRTYFNDYKDFTPAPGIEEGEVEYAITRAEWQSLQGR